MFFAKIKEDPFVFFLAVPLLVMMVLWGLGFDGLYGQDSYEYFRYTNRLIDFFKGGEYPGDLVWPKGYLFLSALLSVALPAAMAGQLLSLSCFYLAFYFLYRILKLFYEDSRNQLIYLLVAFLFSPYILRLGMVMMADTLAILCLTACSYYALCYSRNKNMGNIIWATFWASFGAFSRYAVLVPISPILFWIFIIWLKEREWKQLIALLIPISLLLIHHYFEGGGSDFLSHHFIEQWSFNHLWNSEFFSATGQQLPDVKYTFPNILYYTFGFLHPGFFFLIPILLLFLIKHKNQLKLPLALGISLLVYSVFLAGITFQSNRYLSLTYPLLILLFYPAFQELLKWFGRWKNQLLLLILILQLGLFYHAMNPSFQMNSLEQYLVKELKDYQSQTLYSFEVDIALRQRGLDFEYINLWEQEYKTFEHGALVLFNEERFQEMFKGKSLMNNWKRLNAEYQLSIARELDLGWKLYRING